MTRREAIAQSSPPLQVLLGVLLVEAVVSTATLAWNLVSICRRRDEFT